MCEQLPRWRDLGLFTKIICCIILVPVLAGALLLPVYAVYGFVTGDYVGAVICTVLSIPLLAFWVIPFLIGLPHLIKRRSR